MVIGVNKKEEGYFVNTYEPRRCPGNRTKVRSSRLRI